MRVQTNKVLVENRFELLDGVGGGSTFGAKSGREINVSHFVLRMKAIYYYFCSGYHYTGRR